jgi:hypothetical protein
MRTMLVQKAKLGIFATMFLSALSLPSYGQPEDVDALVECMMSKTTGDNKGLMKKLFVAVLTEDDGATKSYIIQLGAMISDLALTKCQMDFAWLAGPEFQLAAKRYGERIGMQVMQEAMARIK